MELLRNPVFVLLVLAWMATFVGVPWSLTLPVTTVGLVGLQMSGPSDRVLQIRHVSLWRDGAAAVLNALLAAGITIAWGTAVKWLIAG
jgi:hypothetical protein